MKLRKFRNEHGQEFQIEKDKNGIDRVVKKTNDKVIDVSLVYAKQSKAAQPHGRPAAHS